MIHKAVCIIECSVLFFAVLKALFSVLNLKIKSLLYISVLLPLLNVFFAESGINEKYIYN